MRDKNTTKTHKGNKETIRFILTLLSIALFLAAGPSPARPQERTGVEEDVLPVFLECEGCDIPFLQEQISFVRFVSSLEEALVHVRIQAAETREGETAYMVSFTGRKDYSGDDDELTFPVKETREERETWKELAERMKMVLMRYVGKMSLSGRISVRFLEEVKPTAVEDPWNFWVFSLSANTFLNGEQTYRNGSLYGSFSANRVTPEWKIRTSLNASYSKSKFTFDETSIESSSESQGFNGLVVKSIDDHWSVGAYFSASSSSYRNVRLSLSPAPAVEFNLFPYSESTKRQLRFLYRLGFTSVRYREETIYQKTYESLWKQALSVALEVKQKWGTAGLTLEGSHYFHDFSKNRLGISADLSLRLFKGLNFNIDGSYSRIRDQLSLARAGASLEEVLLRRKELETGYQYFVSVGLSYTFGSTRSKVVNPRFGSGGTSISISF